MNLLFPSEWFMSGTLKLLQFADGSCSKSQDFDSGVQIFTNL